MSLSSTASWPSTEIMLNWLHRQISSGRQFLASPSAMARKVFGSNTADEYKGYQRVVATTKRLRLPYRHAVYPANQVSLSPNVRGGYILGQWARWLEFFSEYVYRGSKKAPLW